MLTSRRVLRARYMLLKAQKSVFERTNHTTQKTAEKKLRSHFGFIMSTLRVYVSFLDIF